MAKTTNGQRSFRELVSEAPISARADTLRLVGALSRSHEAGKFVLTLADGRSVTLNIDAVKEHRVLGDAAGQQLVEVDLDAERVPRDIASATPGGFSPAGVVNPSPFPWSLFWLDYPKSPWTDTHPGHWPDVKIPYIDHQIAGPVGVPPGGDPWGGYGAGQTLAPFALATPQQAPQATLAAMQGAARLGGNFGPTIWWWDQHTAWWLDSGYTHPIVDAGATGVAPYYD